MITTEQLRTALADPACPVGPEWSDYKAAIRAAAEPPRRYVTLPDLVVFLRRTFPEVTIDERAVDRLMSDEIGAERQVLLDPSTAPRRLLRRLRGHRDLKPVAYELPVSN